MNSKQIYFYRSLFLILVIDIFLVIIFSNINNFNGLKLAKLIISVLFFTMLFYLGPLIYLFLTYTRRNRNQVFEFTNNSEIVIKSGELIEKIPFSKIKNLEIHLSKTSYENRMKWLFWDELFYYQIVLKNGKKFVITCFVGDDIEKFFSKRKIKKIKRIFPNII